MFEGFTSSIQALMDRLKGRGIITESDLQEMFDKLREVFLSADVPLRVTKDILASLRHELVGKAVITRARPDEQIVHAVYRTLKELLGDEATPFAVDTSSTILVLGLQGAGKTTTLAKLAAYIRRQQPKLRILMVSLDFQRPAAREQLAQLGHRMGIDVYWTSSQDPVQAALEAQQYRLQNRYGVLLIDTAGRLHTSDELLKEIEQVTRQVNPTHRILVLDGMTGQQSLAVAQQFQQVVDLTGAIITKVDSGARAGSVVGFCSVIKKPILFLGTGESLEELDQFIPERVARRLLGDGDLATLWERAQTRISAEEQERVERAFKRGVLTLEDFSQQLSMLNKLGSLTSLMKYMPSMGGISLTAEQMHKGEHDMRRFRAIMSSMTQKERLIPAIINGTRRQRIAAGAGVTVSDVNRLLAAFEQSQKLVKLMSKMKPSR